MATYCVASYCKPLRLLQAIVLQGIASLGGYDKQSHCKQLQDNASHCGYCKLMHCKLLQDSAAIAKYRVASYCKPLRLLQAIALQDIALQTFRYKPLRPHRLSFVASYASHCCYHQLLHCKLLHTTTIYGIASFCILLLTIASVRMPLQDIAALQAMQANVYYCKPLRLLQAMQGIATVNYCKLEMVLRDIALQAIANHCDYASY